MADEQKKAVFSVLCGSVGPNVGEKKTEEEAKLKKPAHFPLTAECEIPYNDQNEQQNLPTAAATELQMMPRSSSSSTNQKKVFRLVHTAYTHTHTHTNWQGKRTWYLGWGSKRKHLDKGQLPS